MTVKLLKPKVIYVAGPYTGGDVAINVKAAMLYGSRLIDEGHTPIIPHLTHFLHLMEPRHYEDWLDYDFRLLEMCDILHRLPGRSPGADREVAHAKSLGLEVVIL